MIQLDCPIVVCRSVSESRSLSKSIQVPWCNSLVSATWSVSVVRVLCTSFRCLLFEFSCPFEFSWFVSSWFCPWFPSTSRFFSSLPPTQNSVSNRACCFLHSYFLLLCWRDRFSTALSFGFPIIDHSMPIAAAAVFVVNLCRFGLFVWWFVRGYYSWRFAREGVLWLRWRFRWRCLFSWRFSRRFWIVEVL